MYIRSAYCLFLSWGKQCHTVEENYSTLSSVVEALGLCAEDAGFETQSVQRILNVSAVKKTDILSPKYKRDAKNSSKTRML